MAGYILGRLGGSLEEGLSLLQQSTDLDPNFAVAWAYRGILNGIIGDYEVAIEHAERALRLSPRDRLQHTMFSALGHAQFFKGNYRDAVRCADEVLRAQPRDTGMLPIRAASFALADDLDGARNAIANLVAIYPTMSVSQVLGISPHRSTVLREKLARGLRLAGLPE
jgi:adenylate cyclase